MFVLTNGFSARTVVGMTDPDVLALLRAYPQIYLACHVEHRSRRESPTGLTSRDAAILAHIAEPEGSSPARLARHLGVARSTLSAALKRLEGQGMLALEPDRGDARRRLVRLTAKGSDALVAGSVLDPARLGAILDGMTAADRRKAVEGLEKLAAAARRHQEEEG